MRFVTSREMKEIERIAIEEISMPSILLMENAAVSIVNQFYGYLKDLTEPVATVICGKGNNGGDGLAIARQLYARNVRVQVVLAGGQDALAKENKANFIMAENLGLPVYTIGRDTLDDQETEKIAEAITKSHVVIDALLGSGLNAPVRGLYASLVNLMNLYSGYTVSVDIPSGINADTGSVMGSAVRADMTVALGAFKIGNIVGDGKEYCGDLKLGNIGIPPLIEDRLGPSAMGFTAEDVKYRLPVRKIRSNKGTFGNVMVLGGSDTMPGAVSLAGLGAYRSGCGLVHICSTKSVTGKAQGVLKEAVTTILPDHNGFITADAIETLKGLKPGAAVVGPGLGNNETTAALMKAFTAYADFPVVADADALNILADDKITLSKASGKWVLTPHPAEMARLTGKSVTEILENIPYAASEFSKKYGVITLLKDAVTVVSDENGLVYINTTGNQSLAKGGSGDVLSGVIASFMAQGLEPFDAACVGAYVHGRAGEIASENLGMYGVLAGETADCISLAIDLLSK